MSVAHIYANPAQDRAAPARAGWARALSQFLTRVNERLDRAAERQELDKVREDANYVRGLAGRMLYLSPGMAADLRAAADRYEEQQGL